jgi:4-hydroxybenzoyl-CoA thioesterase
LTATPARPEPFTTTVPVRFGDVDPAGIAYYPRLINFLHVALEEFFAGRVGKPYASAIEEGLLLPTARLEIDFVSPARFGDQLVISVTVEHVGRTSIRMRYDGRVKRGQDGRWEMQPVFVARSVVVAVTGSALEPTPVPDWLRERLERDAAADACGTRAS